VRQSVIAARAAGQLQAAGPEYDGPAPYDKAAAHSQLTRAEVRHEVAVARAEGLLAPAGEASTIRTISADRMDIGTTSLIEVRIDQTQGRTWFLFGANRQGGSSGH